MWTRSMQLVIVYDGRGYRDYVLTFNIKSNLNPSKEGQTLVDGETFLAQRHWE